MKYKNSIFLILTLLSQFIIVSPSIAEKVNPQPRNTMADINYDKSTVQGSLTIWDKESGGFSSTWSTLWGRNYLVCYSSSDTTNGKCPTQASEVGEGGKTSIELTFTEQRTGLQTVLTLQGQNFSKAHNASGCWSTGYISGGRVINSRMSSDCSTTEHTEEKLFTVIIPPNQLAKVPTGGIWTAQLKMKLMEWAASGDPLLAVWKADITLNATDKNNQQIYLPEFGSARPRVDLNLRPVPGTGGKTSQMHGTADIDMCLYDGYNSQSSTFFITMTDKAFGVLSRDDRTFSIIRDGGNASNPRDVMNYTIDMLIPVVNSYRFVSRTDQVVMENIQQAKVRQVHIPGIPQAVVCVPAPLKLQTEWMDIKSKNAGHYTGILEITFTTSL